MVVRASFSEETEIRIIVGVHQVKGERGSISGEVTACANVLRSEETWHPGKIERSGCG